MTPTITQIENKILTVVSALGLFATVQSCGRQELPPAYAYPAVFVYFDGDEAVVDLPRPVDVARFKVVIQTTNLSGEDCAACDSYTLNDAVREILRGKTLGLNIPPLSCDSRICTDYNDSDGMIEYTHTYHTKLYSPVPVD